MKAESKKVGFVYYITEPGTNPRLGAKVLKDGKTSLFLDYNYGIDKASGKRIREREGLKMYIATNPSRTEQAQNKCTIEAAKIIQSKKSMQLIEGVHGIKLLKDKPKEFITSFGEWINTETPNMTCSMSRMVKWGYSRFIDYCKKNSISQVFMGNVDEDFCERYGNYIKKECSGSGAKSVFIGFRMFVDHLSNKGYIQGKPYRNVHFKQSADFKKEILSREEIEKLVKTPCTYYPDVKRAFLFSLFTGLRWCDIENLTFANIDKGAGIMRVTQKKTKGLVTIPLTSQIIEIANARKCIGDESKIKVFDLPKRETKTKALEKWVHDAGIKKHITWHCARHTFAVQLLSRGADIKTTSALLGHSGIAITERYLHVVDDLKIKAVAAITDFDLHENEKEVATEVI